MMVVIYSYLEREGYKILNFIGIVLFTLKNYFNGVQFM